MALISIDLQDGFERDTVVIRIDGREIFRADDVKTRYQIGLARQVETLIEAASFVLEVELIQRGASLSREIQAAGDVFLGISFSPSNGLTLRESPHEFWYA